MKHFILIASIIFSLSISYADVDYEKLCGINQDNYEFGSTDVHYPNYIILSDDYENDKLTIRFTDNTTDNQIGLDHFVIKYGGYEHNLWFYDLVYSDIAIVKNGEITKAIQFSADRKTISYNKLGLISLDLTIQGLRKSNNNSVKLLAVDACNNDISFEIEIDEDLKAFIVVPHTERSMWLSN